MTEYISEKNFSFGSVFKIILRFMHYNYNWTNKNVYRSDKSKF